MHVFALKTAACTERIAAVNDEHTICPKQLPKTAQEWMLFLLTAGNNCLEFFMLSAVSFSRVMLWWDSASRDIVAQSMLSNVFWLQPWVCYTCFCSENCCLCRLHCSSQWWACYLSKAVPKNSSRTNAYGNQKLFRISCCLRVFQEGDAVIS